MTDTNVTDHVLFNKVWLMWVWEIVLETTFCSTCIQGGQTPKSVPEHRWCSNICGHPEVTINIVNMAAGRISSAQVHRLRTRSNIQRWQEPEVHQLEFHTSGGWDRTSYSSSLASGCVAGRLVPLVFFQCLVFIMMVLCFESQHFECFNIWFGKIYTHVV